MPLPSSICPLSPSAPIATALIQPPLLLKTPNSLAVTTSTRRTVKKRQTHNVASATAAATLTRQRDIAKFLAGGLAGSVSAFFTNPLEVLRTRVQASGSGRTGRSIVAVARSIIKVDGLKGLYNGLGVSLIGSLPSRSIYFSTYATTKDFLTRALRKDSPIIHLVSAVAAGATSNFVMSPLWVVRTRIQLNARQYRGYLDACLQILKHEGVSGFYRGFSASLWGTSEAAIHFVLYEHLKNIQRQRLMRIRQQQGHHVSGTPELSPLAYTLTAAASKLFASMATYPHERVRVLMREVPKIGCTPKYRTMIQSLRLIVKEEGWAALYRGMGCHLCRTVPNTAIMFLSYEIISKNIERRHKRKMAELQRVQRKHIP